MAISANTLVPRVIALAAVGYCVWPSLTAFVSETESKPPAKLPALETTLLRPKMPPQPARDPFQVQSCSGGGLAAQVVQSGRGHRRGQLGHRRRHGEARQSIGRADARCHLHCGHPAAGGDQRPLVCRPRDAAGVELGNAAVEDRQRAPVQGIVGVGRKDPGVDVFQRCLLSCRIPRCRRTCGGPDGVTAGSGAKKPHAFTGARSSGNSRTSGTGK